MSVVAIDWLHTVDKGTAADYIGNLMWLLQQKKMPGSTVEQRVGEVFKDIVEYYKEANPDTQLQDLTPGMIRTGSTSPCFHGKAAEARFLVPWAVRAAAKFLDPTDAFENTVIQCGLELQQCYNCLSAATFKAEVLEACCRRFALLLVALEARSPDQDCWVCKPKLHLMQKLCETTGSCPSQSWTYRDEDMAGSVAALSQWRGGAKNPHSVGVALFERFVAQNPFPRL